MMQKCYRVNLVNETTVDYWLTITGAKSIREIAKATGLDQSKVNRQLNGSSDLRVQTVVAICRVYGLEMAPVFVKAGFLTDREAREFSAATLLRDYTDIELSKEMLRRVTEGSASPAITAPPTPELVDHVVREVEAEHKSNNVSGVNDDLTTLDEDDIRTRYGLAAGKDSSAEEIDPETL